MKSFIDRVFRKKKENAEQIKAKVEEQIVEQPTTQVESAKEKATQAAIEAITEESSIYVKPGHYFPDCNCIKCIRWRNQNAK